MRTLTSTNNDAVRVTLSKDSKEISEKQKQSQEYDNVIETEIVSESNSDQQPVNDKVDSNEDYSDSESNEKNQDADEEKMSSNINEASETKDDETKDDETEDDPETTLKKKQDDLDAVQDRLLRLSAEFENYKKRNRREISDFKKFAAEVLIKDLLPVIDSLDRALETTTQNDEACKAIYEGVSLTRDEMLKIFSKYGVQSIDALEKSFDPAFHQAVGQEPSEDHPDNTVLKEYQKGYTMHGRLLRPSMVVVSKK